MTISNASTMYNKFHLKLANIAPDTYLLSAATSIEMFSVGYRKEVVLSNTDLDFVGLKKIILQRFII
jgi:hypothetical protein